MMTLYTLMTFTALSTSWHTTCGITDAGALKCWGNGRLGQLGDAQKHAVAAPQDVPGFESGVTAVAAGWLHGCAVKGGKAFCWGGYGAHPPKEVPGFTSSETVTALAAGREHTCALLSSGAVRCWGKGDHGQLGDGDASLLHRLDAAGPAVPIPAAKQVVAGGAHTCALVENGDVYCWGEGYNGQIGNGQTANAVQPAKVGGLEPSARIAASEQNTCAVSTSGKLRCWGDAWWSQLGANDVILANTPKKLSDATEDGIGLVTVGRGHICAQKADKLLCFGDRLMRQIGEAPGKKLWFTPDVADQYFDQRASKPDELKGLPELKDLVAGKKHTCALAKDGKALCWGEGILGQLGNGTVTTTGTPTPVGTP